MPRWVNHAKALIGLRRRWSVNASFGEILTGVLPVIQVDKVLPTEDQDIYGLFTQALADGVNLPACQLTAQRQDVLVMRIEVFVDAVSQRFPNVHIFTPLQTYDPFDVSLQGIFFPWLQGGARPPANDQMAQATGQLGSTFGAAGIGSALMTVSVNGFPISAIGPVHPLERWTTFVGSGGGENRMIWSMQDPPIRVRPFQSLVVQAPLGGMLGNGTPLNVNWYYSERREQGTVS